jgi:hypothetical protein
MILETISLDENTKIYKGKLGLFDKFNQKEYIDKIIYLKHLYPEYVSHPRTKFPGYQYTIFAQYDEIDFMYSEVKNWAKENLNIHLECMIKSWVYMSDKSNVYSGYHAHPKTQYEDRGIIKEFDSTFVTTYYLQMPNNLEGDDGYIYFKTKDEKEFGFLPKEDEIIIFPADLEHNVRLNKKSTIPRICIASNYMYFNYKDAKLNKTLF